MTVAQSLWVPELGEIVWLNFTPQAGKEMAGQHPILVLSPKQFNAKTKTVMGLTMTSQQHGDPKARGFIRFSWRTPQARRKRVLSMPTRCQPLTGKHAVRGHILGEK